MENNELITNLEETIIRLHAYLRNCENNNDDYKKLLKKTRKKGISILTLRDKIELQEYVCYKFQQGKLYGYLDFLSSITPPKLETLADIIRRLRGMEFGDKGQNTIIETKSYRWGPHKE